MKLLLKILGTLIVIALIILGLLFLQTSRIQKSENNRQFTAGKIPTTILDGFYEGGTDFYKGSWKGKTFYSTSSTGINNFEAEKTDRLSYPFETYTGKGLQDTATDVFKIDYKNATNPVWLRPVLDEIVEVAPGEYLGKIHYRLIPNHPFTIGYFRLSKVEKVKNVTNSTSFFTVSLPQNWKASFDDDAGNSYNGIISSSPNFQFRRERITGENFDSIYYEYGAQVNIRKDPGPDTAQKDPPGTVEEHKPMTVDGVPGTYLVYKEPSTKQGQLLGFRTVYKENSYIFRFAYNPKTFPNGPEIFEQILSSFHFKN